MSGGSESRSFAAYARATAGVGALTRIEVLLQAIAEQACGLLDVDRCAVFVADEHGGRFRSALLLAAGVRTDAELEGCVVGGPGDGVGGEAIATGRPVVVANARTDPRLQACPLRRLRCRSLLVVPLLSAGRTVGLLALDAIDRRHSFGPADVALAGEFGEMVGGAYAQADTRLKTAAELAAARRQLAALRTGTSIDERLRAMVLDGRPLAEIVQALADLLQRPAAVFPCGEGPVQARPAGAAERALPWLLGPRFAAAAEVESALAAGDRRHVSVVGPLPRIGLLTRQVMAPIWIGEELWGRLVVIEEGRRFSGGDLIALRTAAGLIALQAVVERKSQEAEVGAGATVVADLLSAGAFGADAHLRLERLGVPAGANKVVLLFSCRDEGGGDPVDFREVALAFRRLASELSAQVAPVDGAAAAIVQLPAEDGAELSSARRRQLERVRRSLRGGDGIVAGVSEVFVAAHGYRAAYLQARQVTECIRRFSPRGGPALFGAADLGIAGLLLSNPDPATISSFAEEALGELLAADNSRADLLGTLCAFFAAAGNVGRCAEALHVHTNTVRYRLARVEELTGLAVANDPAAQLKAQLSLLVLRLRGSLPLPRQATEPGQPPLGIAAETFAAAAITAS